MCALPLVLLASMVQGGLTLGLLKEPLHLQLAQEPFQLGLVPAPAQPLVRTKRFVEESKKARKDCTQV